MPYVPEVFRGGSSIFVDRETITPPSIPPWWRGVGGEVKILLIDFNVFIHISASYDSIEQHVGAAGKNNPVAGHITGNVGDMRL